MEIESIVSDDYEIVGVASGAEDVVTGSATEEEEVDTLHYGCCTVTLRRLRRWLQRAPFA
jgi:hypothetical protein